MKSYMTNLMLYGKLMLRIGFILCSIFFLSYQDAQASHIVGGDLRYRCLGNNMYEIRLSIRRDCFLGDSLAQFDDPASVGFFDGVTNQLLTFIGTSGQLRLNYNEDDTLNEILVSDCSVISGDVCVHTTVYVDTIELFFRPTGYIMAYQRCCRNESLTNVLNPDATGMTLVAELSGLAQTQCNSSPQFGPYPPIYACVNKEINFSHAASDAEGDSLVYSLCTPYAGGTQQLNRPQPPPPPPYAPIIYRPPYGPGNLMGGVPLVIDPATGIITGTPNTVGQFVVGICVTAYTDGVMTATTRRDFQYNVRMCRDVPVAQFTAPTLDCEDLTVFFDNQSILADEYLWIFDYPNPNSATSTLFEPSFTYSQGGFYNVALIVNDSNEFCFDTIVRQIGVFDSQIAADFTYDVSSCTENIVLNITDGSIDPDPAHDIVSWNWIVTVGDSLFFSTLQNPTFSFSIEGTETVLAALTVTSSNGCTATNAKVFPVQQITLQFNPLSDSICFGESTHILLNGDPTLTYTWDPTLGLDLTFPHDPIAQPGLSVVYCVTVTDGLCEVTGCTPVNVQQLPTLAFDYSTDCKSLVVQFDNNSVNGVNFHYDFGVPNVSNDTLLVNAAMGDISFTYPTPGIYTVTLSSRDGCDVSVTQQITADAITETLEDQTLSCFQESVQLNPDFNPLYTYVWSDPSLIGPNPTVTVLNDTEFFVTITTPGLPDCEIVDSITIIVNDAFTVDAGGDVTTCLVADVLLTATSNGDVDFVWDDCNGNILGNLSTLVVTPTTTDTFCVTATDSFGCTQSDQVIVNRPEPTFFVLASNDTSYCNIQSITITALTIPDVTLQWFNEDGVLIGEGPSVEVTPGSGPACFTVIGTDLLGCQNDDEVCLTPTFFDLAISGDQSICLDETVEVFVIDNLDQDLSFLWTPIESIKSGAVTDTAVVMPMETTTYTVLVTNNDLGCTTELSTTVEVNLFDPLIVVITADPDSIILTQTTQLMVNQPSGYGYSWTASNGEIIPPVRNPTVTPTTNPTTYSVTVTNEAGCTETATISVRVADPPCSEKDIFLPNAFTPNGDGVNDVLFVRSNFISTLEIHIYNRWGEEVFKSFDQALGWDGTFKGEQLPPDVFGYYMQISCPNGKEYFEKGNITLLE